MSTPMSVVRTLTTDATDATNAPALDDRDRRAMLEGMSVEPIAPGMYSVRKGDGTEYVVDIDGGACTCPDFRYREVECKHLRRARLEAGETDTDRLEARLDDAIDATDERIDDLAARRTDLVRLRAALARFE
jgi:predicted nucleic acid-binding Zn finger protein